MNKGIVVFLPSWNEALNLPLVVGDAVEFLQTRNVPFEVIIVDDGSTDNTVQVARTLEQTYPGNVRLVQHERNRGYGAAFRTGLKAGLGTGLEWVCLCDGDGQFDIADMGKLIDAADTKGADVSIGYRIERADGLKRRLMGQGWHFVSRLFLGYKALDTDCGFKAFRRPALEVIYPQLVGDHATISPEILARIHRQGFNIVEVGVNHFARVHGEQSGANLRVVLGSFMGLLQVWSRIHGIDQLHHRLGDYYGFPQSKKERAS
jgi:glycosyltransferase involved in cell wall biosynthesis